MRQSDNLGLRLSFPETSCVKQRTITAVVQTLLQRRLNPPISQQQLGAFRHVKVVQSEHLESGRKGIDVTLNVANVGCYCQTGLSECLINCWSTNIFHDITSISRFCRELTQKGKISRDVRLSGGKCILDVRRMTHSPVTLFDKRYQHGAPNKVFNESTLLAGGLSLIACLLLL